MPTPTFEKRALRPRAVLAPGANETKHVDQEHGVIAIVDAESEAPSLAQYISSHRSELEGRLARSGGLLFRGFATRSALDFREAVLAMGVAPLPYLERAAIRQEVLQGVFTSTEFSPTQWVDLHHEMSFAKRIPGRIFFYAESVAERGGETPVADEARVTAKIDKAISKQFLELGLIYTRNFRSEVDMDWRSAFQTDSREDVARYCSQNGIEWSWRGEEHLCTLQRQQAFVRNPLTGELLFCNHAHIFHPVAMHEVIRETLLSEYGADGLPRNVTFGDGSPIPDSTIIHIRKLYEECRLMFPWQAGDVLLLDNVRCLHGRAPFSGKRITLVSMTGLVDRNV